ncbi:LacI family DNA-binding transcriptional regulator [Arthrobacter sp. MW3 TE3886]|jgi:LacI family transcriptional regulator|uniref:LacI family DNA-binding transcriptional regulator n=1 Tax=Arthrobacter sp. MW3 TE3886 TaxID=3156254 RepID=UPI0035189F6E
MADVTLEDVGKHAGVSRATVSLVARGSQRVASETSKRVKLSMAELGYVYNRHAAGMRQQQTMLLGFVATDIQNPFFAQVTMSIESVARKAGYTLLVGYSHDDPLDQQELITTMAQRRVDGILLQPSLGTTGQVAVDAGNVPIVQLVRSFSDEFDYVGLDNIQAGKDVAAHIAAIGAKSALFIGAPEGSAARQERLRGITSGLEGLQVRFSENEAVVTKNNLDGGSYGTAFALDHGMLPDVIVAHSDAVALGVYVELRRRNIEPGRDIAVIGFDDIPLASALFPTLTSVGTLDGKLGEVAAETMLWRLQSPQEPPRQSRVRTVLRVRASTAQWRPRRA